MDNHYFNASHPLRPYTHSTPANPGTMPPANALRGDKPTAPAGYWPGESGGAWIDIEDHRGLQGWLDGEPYTVTDFGPLPDGWSDAAPEPEPITPTLADLSRENQRRLDLSKLGQEVERKVVTGEDIDPDVLAYRKACIEAYNNLKAMDPPPSDYMNDKYWPDLPA